MGLFDWLSNRLPTRKIEWEDTHTPNEPLPQRNIIKVKTQVRSMSTLAQVRNNWLGTKLILRFSHYISFDYSKDKKWNQALQVCLHELMHCALYEDKSITHSTDEKSLLYSMVDGSNLDPIEWDLKVMKDAARRIDAIEISTEGIKNTAVGEPLMRAVVLWNYWIGRELFILS